jgi:hypothetical protein
MGSYLSSNTMFTVGCVDDYSFVRHPPRHRLGESACERAREMGVSFLSGLR